MRVPLKPKLRLSKKKVQYKGMRSWFLKKQKKKRKKNSFRLQLSLSANVVSASLLNKQKRRGTIILLAEVLQQRVRLHVHEQEEGTPPRREAHRWEEIYSHIYIWNSCGTSFCLVFMWLSGKEAYIANVFKRFLLVSCVNKPRHYVRCS